MTRFETLDGQQLGARFAGDNGATMHLTSKEATALFSLDKNEELISDNGWSGTADDLIEMLRDLETATSEQMMRRFKSDGTLHWKQESKLFLDTDGQLCEGTIFKR
tara:strand:+ start:1597 stop:1914 length:318 start_codon:yes stop_codon:yes gene_type:complete